MDPILETIDEALKKKGLSDAAASRLAVGHPSLIKNFRMERTGEKRYNLSALNKLASVLGLELYFGTPRLQDPPPSIDISGEEFAAVHRLAAEASAGPGALNGDAEIVGALAFRRDWLAKLGVNPARACLVTVRGDSMAPGLRPGDLALIDHQRSEVAPGKVFAFNDIDGETRIKRLERPDEKSLILYSDNQAYAPELRKGVDLNRIKILGQVVWSGHNWA